MLSQREKRCRYAITICACLKSSSVFAVALSFVRDGPQIRHGILGRPYLFVTLPLQALEALALTEPDKRAREAAAWALAAAAAAVRASARAPPPAAAAGAKGGDAAKLGVAAASARALAALPEGGAMRPLAERVIALADRAGSHAALAPPVLACSCPLHGPAVRGPALLMHSLGP